MNDLLEYKGFKFFEGEMRITLNSFKLQYYDTLNKVWIYDSKSEKWYTSYKCDSKVEFISIPASICEPIKANPCIDCDDYLIKFITQVGNELHTYAWKEFTVSFKWVVDTFYPDSELICKYLTGLYIGREGDNLYKLAVKKDAILFEKGIEWYESLDAPDEWDVEVENNFSFHFEKHIPILNELEVKLNVPDCNRLGNWNFTKDGKPQNCARFIERVSDMNLKYLMNYI